MPRPGDGDPAEVTRRRRERVLPAVLTLLSVSGLSAPAAGGELAAGPAPGVRLESGETLTFYPAARPNTLYLGMAGGVSIARPGGLPPGPTDDPAPALMIAELHDIAITVGPDAGPDIRDFALDQAIVRAGEALGMTGSEARARTRWIETDGEVVSGNRLSMTLRVIFQEDPPEPVAAAAEPGAWDIVVPVYAEDGLLYPFHAGWLAAWKHPHATAPDLATADGDGEDRAIVQGAEALDPSALDIIRRKYGARDAWYAVLWREGDDYQIEFIPLQTRHFWPREDLCCPGCRPAEVFPAAVQAARRLGVTVAPGGVPAPPAPVC